MSNPTSQKNPGWLTILMNRQKAIAGKVIAVGFPSGKCQAYPDGESVAQVAYDNCNGVGCIQRDFMTYADSGIRQKTAPLLVAIAQQVNIGNDEAVRQLAEAAGMKGAQAVKDAIIEGTWAPNNQANPYVRAKKLRGSDKPLIDTGHMVQSATYVVRNK